MKLTPPDDFKRRVGINPKSPGITVRGIRHFTECLVAMWPTEFEDGDCTCWDDSPEWTDD
jgi:hypothetical protein